MFGTGGFLNPEKLLKDLKIIEPGFVVADFGCGAGYFSLPLAALVGKEGVVNAVDVLENVLKVILSRAKAAGHFNLKTIHANLEKENGSNLSNSSQDAVFMANVLFQSQQKEAIIDEAVRITKINGYIVIIDWLPDSYFKTDQGWRIEPEKLKQILEKKKLKFNQEFQPDDYHYGLIYQKIE
ncbi:class I SAM-dependent methyltransferase [bacterium]|nr:MAG: class I SAM-dependent methyltransferase [bacterium]